MILVTGATGQLGRLVISSLLKKVPATQVIAGVRSPEKAADLLALGVQLRQVEYGEPEGLRNAFAGVEKILLISSSELGQRTEQHRAAIDAAKASGAQLLAYTSLLRADTSTLMLAKEHKATEEMLIASTVPYVMLRNGWYLENHTAQIATALEHGVLPGAAGDGRFASAARADYADAAAAVLAGSGFEGKIFELAGDRSYTLADVAAETTQRGGRALQYKNLSAEEYAGMLEGFGLPSPVARMLADADSGAAKGELDSESRDLSSLIGRPTTTLRAAIDAALHR